MVRRLVTVEAKEPGSQPEKASFPRNAQSLEGDELPAGVTEKVLRRFDEVRARIQERIAHLSEEEIAADVAAARAELPD